MNDLISRQTVINEINERQRKLIYCFGFENDMVKIMDIAKSIVIAIPSAQPRAGHWIEHKWAEEANEMLISNYECSECHYWERYDSNFCPNCGADMRG